jgi:autotransporter-associated beta strand protein
MLLSFFRRLARQRLTAPARRQFRLAVERLEDRRLLRTDFWTGADVPNVKDPVQTTARTGLPTKNGNATKGPFTGVMRQYLAGATRTGGGTWWFAGDPNWSDPGNWSNGVPQQNDDIVFPAIAAANLVVPFNGKNAAGLPILNKQGMMNVGGDNSHDDLNNPPNVTGTLLPDGNPFDAVLQVHTLTIEEAGYIIGADPGKAYENFNLAQRQNIINRQGNAANNPPFYQAPFTGSAGGSYMFGGGELGPWDLWSSSPPGTGKPANPNLPADAAKDLKQVQPTTTGPYTDAFSLADPNPLKAGVYQFDLWALGDGGSGKKATIQLQDNLTAQNDPGGTVYNGTSSFAPNIELTGSQQFWHVVPATATLKLTGIISDDPSFVTGQHSGFVLGGGSDAGTLELDAVNTYSGLTEVSTGILALGPGGTLGNTTSGTTVLAGASLRLLGTDEVDETLVLNGDGVNNLGALQGFGEWQGGIILNGGGIADGTSNSTTVGADPGKTMILDMSSSGASVSGSGDLDVVAPGGGTVVLNQANNYQGITTVTSGTLLLENNNSLGQSPTTSVKNGATLALDDNITVSGNNLTIVGPGVGNNGAFQAVSSSGNPAIESNINLGGDIHTSDTWTGTVTIGDPNVAFNGAWIGADVDGENPGIQSILTILGQLLTPSGLGAGSGDLTKVGQGILVLPNGSPGFLGNSIINNGIVLIENALSLGPSTGGTITVNTSATASGTLQVQGGTAANPLTVNKTLTLNGGGFNNLGALDVIDPNATTASNVVWAGSINLASNTSISVDPTPTGTSPLATLTINGGMTGVGGQHPTILEKDGQGTLVLLGPNPMWFGQTTMRLGVTIIDDPQALGGTGSVGATVEVGATLEIGKPLSISEILTLEGPGFQGVGALESLAGDSEWNGKIGLSQTQATVNVVAGHLVFNGVVSGSVGLDKIGAGTLALSGATSNTANGTTTVSQGTVYLAKDTSNPSAFAIAGALVVGDTGGTAGISTATEVGNVVTITTPAIPGLNSAFFVGNSVTIASVGVSGYNGTFQITGTDGATFFTYTDTNPGASNLAASGGGTATITETADSASAKWANNSEITAGTSVTVNPDGYLDVNGFNQTLESLTLVGGDVATANDTSVAGLGSGVSSVPLGRLGTLTLGDTLSQGSLVTLSPNGSGVGDKTATISGQLALGGTTNPLFDVSPDTTLDNNAVPGSTPDLDVKAVISGGPGLGLELTGPGFGGGIMQFDAVNTYSGSTTVTGGVLQAGVTGAVPDTPLVLSGNFLQPATFAALTGTNQKVSSVAGNSTDTLALLGTGSLTTGDDNTSTSFDGTTTGAGTLTKIGTGTLTLDGASTSFTGTVNIFDGVVLFNNDYSSATVNVANGPDPSNPNASSTLGGDAPTSTTNTTGPITVKAAGGTIDPGSPVTGTGIINAKGNVTFTGATTFTEDITVSGGNVTGFDQLNATGTNSTVTLGGAQLVVNASALPTSGKSVTIINATGGVSGTFAGLPTSGDTITVPISGGGLASFVITYNANSVVLTAINSTTTTLSAPSPASSAPNTSPGPLAFGTPVTLAATVSPVPSSSNAPTGSVSFYDGGVNGTLLGTVNSTQGAPAYSASGGVATYTLITTALSASGSPHSDIVAVYNGEPNVYGASTSAAATPAVYIATASLTGKATLNASPPTPAYGQSVTFTLTLTGVSGAAAPTGTVTFFDQTTNSTVGTVTYNGPSTGTGSATGYSYTNGVATYTLTVNNLPFYTGSPPTGTPVAQKIVANYAGDQNYNSSQSNTVQETVQQGSVSVSLSESPSSGPVPYNQKVTLTATVTPQFSGSANPAGNGDFVTFTDTTTHQTVKVTTQKGSGDTAVATTVWTETAADKIVATFSDPSGSYADGTTGTGNQVTLPGPVQAFSTTTQILPSADPVMTGTPVTFTVLVTAPSGGGATPTGSVDVTLNGNPMIDHTTPAGQLDSNGEVTFTMALPAGGYTFQATYFSSNPAEFATGSIGVLTELVTAAPPPPAPATGFAFPFQMQVFLRKNKKGKWELHLLNMNPDGLPFVGTVLLKKGHSVRSVFVFVLSGNLVGEVIVPLSGNLSGFSAQVVDPATFSAF